MPKLLECQNIYKKFGKKEILKGVSFSIDKGDILAFIGPNGAGKTTTIKLILGLQDVDEGNVYLNGFNIKTDFEDAIKEVGAIVENPDSYMYLSGYQNLKLIANLYPEITEERIKEVVKIVKLEDRIYDKVNKYSLGMRQRLGIAKALLNKPKVLALDEPTNGLDPEGIKDLRELLKRLAKEGLGILISSHNLAELESFCNKVVVIDNGEIVDTGDVTNFKKKEEIYSFKVSSTKNLIIEGIYNKTINSFNYNGNKKDIADLIKILVEKGIDIYEVKEEVMTLEEAFLKKTKGGKNVKTNK